MRYGIPADKPLEATIRVRMLKTTRATLDGGKTAMTCQQGMDYDLPEWLAEAFFKGGEADPAEAHEAVAHEAEQTHADLVTTPRRRARK